MQLLCMMHILNIILLYAGPKADSAHRVVRLARVASNRMRKLGPLSIHDWPGTS